MRLLFASLLLLGCARPLAEPEFVLEIAGSGEFGPVNGAATDDYSVIAQDWVFEPLLRVSGQGALAAGLADRFERTDRGALRVRIRSGASFSDGAKVTAADVIGALPAQLRARPEGDWIVLESSIPGVPADALALTVFVTRRAGGTVLGSGPFVVAEQDKQRVVLLRRSRVRGRINEIRMRSYPTPREALARTLRGDANLLPALEVRSVELFEGIGRLRVIRGPSPQVLGLALNAERLGLATRRSLANAFPVEEARRAAFSEGCRPWPSLPPHGRISTARPLDILASTNEASSGRLGLAVRRALGASGGRLLRADARTAMKSVHSRTYDLAVSPVLVWPPQMEALLFHTGSPYNWLHHANGKVDAELDARNWTGALQAMADDPYFIFICTPERFAVVDSRIKNPQLGPWGLLETLPDWEIAE